MLEPLLPIVRLLLLKSQQKFAHQPGYHLVDGRWHKHGGESGKAAPKGAPQAAHPKAAHGDHIQPFHLAQEQVEKLSLPASNTNAPTYNAQLQKLVGYAAAGDATAILGMKLGTNTYSKKIAEIGSWLLAQMGETTHKLTIGQAAGSHPAVQTAPEAKGPMPAAPAPAPAEPPAAPPAAEAPAAEPTPAPAPAAEAPAAAPAPEAKPSKANGLEMPDFTEGKNTSGVKAYYEKTAQKVIDQALAGNVSVLEDMPKGDGKSWQGKTANSKALLELHAKALKVAKGEVKADVTSATEPPAPAPAEPAPAAKTPGDLMVDELHSEGVMAYLHPTKGVILGSAYASGGTYPKTYANLKQAEKSAGKLTAAGWNASVTGNHPYLVAIHGKLPEMVHAEPSPKDGDTKPGADGTLVFKNGRWHKQEKPIPPEVKSTIDAWTKNGDWNAIETALKNKDTLDPAYAPYLEAALAKKPVATPAPAAPSKLSQIPWDTQELPASNTNAASHNKKVASIKAAAEAGNVAQLHAMKFGTNTYGKKQHLLAQLAVAALKEDAAAPADATAAQPESPGLVPHVKASIDLVAKKNGEAGLESIIAANNWAHGNHDSKAYAEKLLAEMQAPTAPADKWPALVAEMKVNGLSLTGDLKDYFDVLPPEKQSQAIQEASTWMPNGAAEPPTTQLTGPMASLQSDIDEAAAKGDAKTLTDITVYLYNQSDDTPGLQGVKDYLAEKFASLAPPEVGPKEGDTKQGVGGMLVLKDGHWVLMEEPKPAYKKLKPSEAISLGKNLKTSTGKKTQLKALAVAGEGAALQEFIDSPLSMKLPASKQYAKNLLAAMGAPEAAVAAPAPKPKPAPVEQSTAGIPSMDSWKQIGPQGGSNPGGKFVDDEGHEWYCKFPPDQQHARAEVLSAKLYEAMGLKGQDAKLIVKGGKVGIASRWVDVHKGTVAELQGTPGALSGFVADAWLANWDVVGMGYDNLQIGSDGRAMRVDAGGSLMYRAQGAKKPFGNTVDEIDSMRDAKNNAYSASVFGKMTTADMTASAKKVIGLSDDQIFDLVMEHGPGTAQEKGELVETLIARKEDLAKRFPKAVPKEKPKPKPDPSKLQVDPSQLPKPHDFSNWKGQGQGLSSKAHVNEFNAAAEAAVLQEALKGNLPALKDYHYDAVDKETGASLGKKHIESHPSNHVKTYWSDLVATLSFIAYPPEALKKFKTVLATSIKKVSEAFQANKYGTTTKSVEANSRLAFWIALGQTKPAESLLPPGATLAFQSAPVGQPKITPAMTAQAQAAYQGLSSSRPVKRFINGIQGSGSYNDNFRDGKLVTGDGWDAAKMALDAYEFAAEKPEGFEIYKWISFPGDMGKQILAAPAGTVFQNPGSMCASTGPTATSHFGSDRIRIRYAAGAKGVDSFGSGNFAGEKEITTLPGQRYVILKAHKVMCPVKGKERIELDVLMLPPDATYVSELAAMKGKHGGK